MSKSSSNTISFLSFLVIIIAILFIMNSYTVLATRRLNQVTTTTTTTTTTNNNNNINKRLVLGLRNTRATVLIPKTQPKVSNLIHPSTPNSPKLEKRSQPVAMMEPLRAVRDGFLVPLYIGTPPQAIQVYMDTGSDLTWVPCGSNLSFDCLDCDDFRDNKLTAAFSPSHSNTSLRDLCGSAFCVEVHSSENYVDTCTIAGCSLSTLVKSSCSRPCPSFAYTYGEGGVAVGLLTRDTLRVHESMFSPNITREVPDFAFGCVGSTYREPIGIAGFGRGKLSLPSQLGFLQKGFSHCFLPFKFANNPNISSPLVVGEYALSSDNEETLMQFTPMLKSPMYPSYYYIGLEAITVGNSSAITKMPLSLKEFDSQGNGAMLIDSGTTYTHLPEPIYSQLISSLHSVIPYPRADDMEAKTGFDLCYKIPYTNGTTYSAEEPDFLPSITLHFLSNARLVLSRGSHFYAMGAPRNATVVKCLLFQSMEEGNDGPAGVLGSFQQQDVKVLYDLENERIGFQPMDCASSADSHGLYQKP